MEYQEITVFIIVSSAALFTFYRIFRSIFKKDEESGICGSCPYGAKDGSCSKK